MCMKILPILLVLVSYSARSASLILTSGDLNSTKIEVDIQFDGQIKRFQLDTGAYKSMVAPDEQTRAYPSIGKAKLEGAAGKPVECDLISPAMVLIDTLFRADNQFERCDLGEHSFNNLGLDIFEDQILNLDFKKNDLSILNIMPESWGSHPLKRLERGHLKMQALIGGLDSDIIFDTGAQLTSVDVQFVNLHPELFKYITDIDNGKDITGNQVIMKIYELSEIQVGTVTFKNTTVAAFDFNKKLRDYLGENTPLIFGTNAMIQANWIFDLKTNKWGVQP